MLLPGPTHLLPLGDDLEEDDIEDSSCCNSLQDLQRQIYPLLNRAVEREFCQEDPDQGPQGRGDAEHHDTDGVGQEVELVGDQLHPDREGDDELVHGGGPGVEPHSSRLLLQPQRQTLHHAVEGESEDDEDRPDGSLDLGPRPLTISLGFALPGITNVGIILVIVSAGELLLLHLDLGPGVLVRVEEVVQDLLQGGDEEEAGAHDDLSQGEEGVDVPALDALPDLGEPVTETVCYQDATTNVEKEGQDDVLQFLLLFLHDGWIGGVYSGEVQPGAMKREFKFNKKVFR